MNDRFPASNTQPKKSSQDGWNARCALVPRRRRCPERLFITNSVDKLDFSFFYFFFVCTLRPAHLGPLALLSRRDAVQSRQHGLYPIKGKARTVPCPKTAVASANLTGEHVSAQVQPLQSSQLAKLPRNGICSQKKLCCTTKVRHTKLQSHVRLGTGHCKATALDFCSRTKMVHSISSQSAPALENKFQSKQCCCDECYRGTDVDSIAPHRK